MNTATALLELLTALLEYLDHSCPCNGGDGGRGLGGVPPVPPSGTALVTLNKGLNAHLETYLVFTNSR